MKTMPVRQCDIPILFIALRVDNDECNFIFFVAQKNGFQYLLQPILCFHSIELKSTLHYSIDNEIALTKKPQHPLDPFIESSGKHNEKLN